MRKVEIVEVNDSMFVTGMINGVQYNHAIVNVHLALDKENPQIKDNCIEGQLNVVVMEPVVMGVAKIKKDKICLYKSEVSDFIWYALLQLEKETS